MVYFGNVILILAGFISIYTAYLFFVRLKDKRKPQLVRKAYISLFVLFGAITLASLVLLYGFIAKDFSFDYVASYSSADMGLFYRISAFWAGHEGSFLFWLWLLSGFTALLTYFRLREVDRLSSYALAVLNGVQLFFWFFIVFLANPFKPAEVFVSTGLGINPLLLHWAMIFHPPTLFVGYAGLTIPFAYAVAALLARDASSKWVELSFRWTLVSWLLLTIGIFLGAVWAYVVLGWGGYWGWDPVENASLLPWLAGVALLHSFHIYRQRESFKFWALSMAVLSFVLVIIATFITRSGIIQSVHAFAGNPGIVIVFTTFILVVLGLSGYLIYDRRALYEGKHLFSSVFSRDFAYHVNNIFMVFASAVLLMAAFLPLFGGRTVGPTFYNRLAQPLGVAFLAVIALCPILSWGKTSGQRFWRLSRIPAAVTLFAAYPLFIYWQSLESLLTTYNPTKELPVPGWVGYIGLIVAVFTIASVIQVYASKAYARGKSSGRGFLSGLASVFVDTPGQGGGFVTHLGMAILVIGLVGSYMYTVDIPKKFADKAGQKVEVADLSFHYKGLKTTSQGTNKDVYSTEFDIYMHGSTRKVGEIAPRIAFYKLQKQQTREVDIIYEPFRDVFIIFQGQNQDGSMQLDIKINPLISFVWVGSLLFVIGAVLALWPRRTPS